MVKVKEKKQEKEEVFDWDTKKIYLDWIMDSDNSMATYKSVLTKIGKREEELGKAIYNMDLNELETLFSGLKIRGLNSMLNTLHFCKRYIGWAKKHRFAQDRTDRMTTPIDTEYAKRFVNGSINLLYTREEILRNVKDMDDPRYAACILCIFEGIRGQGLEELANLTLDDISCDEKTDVCHALLTGDNGRRRKITISKKLYDMLVDVNSLTSVGNDELAARFSLPKSPYIFKKVERRNALNDVKINVTFMTRTIRKARGIFDNKELVSNDIMKSGIAHYANELMNEAGERVLTNEMLRSIALRFRIGLIEKEAVDYTQNEMDWYYYSYGAIKKFIEADFISDIYGEFRFE